MRAGGCAGLRRACIRVCVRASPSGLLLTTTDFLLSSKALTVVACVSRHRYSFMSIRNVDFEVGLLPILVLSMKLLLPASNLTRGQ